MYLLFWFIMKYSRPEKGYVLGFSAAGSIVQKAALVPLDSNRP